MLSFSYPLINVCERHWTENLLWKVNIFYFITYRRIVINVYTFLRVSATRRIFSNSIGVWVRSIERLKSFTNSFSTVVSSLRLFSKLLCSLIIILMLSFTVTSMFWFLYWLHKIRNSSKIYFIRIKSSISSSPSTCLYRHLAFVICNGTVEL